MKAAAGSVRKDFGSGIVRQRSEQLHPLLDQLLNNPVIQRYVSRESLSDNNKLSELTALFNQFQDLVQEISNQDVNTINVEARVIIRQFLQSIPGTSSILESDNPNSPSQLINAFFQLPADGRFDLGKFIDNQLSTITNGTDRQSVLTNILTVLRAAGPEARYNNINQPQPIRPIPVSPAPAVSNTAGIIIPTSANSSGRRINPDLMRYIIRGSHIEYNMRVPNQVRDQMKALFRAGHSPKIAEALESAITQVQKMDQTGIKSSAEIFIEEEMRKDHSSSAEAIFDRQEFFARTLEQVTAQIAKSSENEVNPDVLETNFRNALIGLRYYFPKN